MPSPKHLAQYIDQYGNVDYSEDFRRAMMRAEERMERERQERISAYKRLTATERRLFEADNQALTRAYGDSHQLKSTDNGREQNVSGTNQPEQRNPRERGIRGTCPAWSIATGKRLAGNTASVKESSTKIQQSLTGGAVYL